ncbi:MAG: hypothetical protein J6Z49_05445 [Kiritimatiellae bacterium]|nr:hypothetical protein [Kiritimatiellia bacterium]
MSLEQFTYTASPWGASAPGWTVFQSSPGAGPKMASVLMPVFEFKSPDSGEKSEHDVVGNHSLPIKFVYCSRKEDGKKVVSQSLDAGLRWYDKTRGQDYFAHVFVEKGEGDLFAGATESFNPVSLLLSPSIQTEFPEEYRERALGILNGDYPDEPTPELPVWETISDIKPNPYFSDEYIFERLSDNLVQKIGRIVFAMSRFMSKDGGSTLAFDGTRASSLDTIAIAVRLLPLVVRRNISFSTWLPSSEMRTFPDAEHLVFVGTVRDGETADPDTGLYGELPQGGPKFGSREDVELFKRMVDDGGTELDAEDFDALVSCWEVVVGLDVSINGMYKANRFCIGKSNDNPRFPKLRALLLEKIAAQLSQDVNTNDVEWLNRFVVARFEIGVYADKCDLRRFCEACAKNEDTFKTVCKLLVDDVFALCDFLKELEHFVSDNEFKVNLTGRLLETYMITMEDVMAVENDLPFIALVLKYQKIRDLGADKSENPDEDITVVEKLQQQLCGTDSFGIGDVLAMLKYRSALLKINLIGDITKYLKLPLPEKVLGRVQDDLVAKLKPSSPKEKIKLAHILDGLKISGDNFIETEWQNDLQRMKDNCEQVEKLKQEKEQGNEQLKEQSEKQHRELSKRLGISGVMCLAILCTVIGWAGHWLFGGCFNSLIVPDAISSGLSVSNPLLGVFDVICIAILCIAITIGWIGLWLARGGLSSLTGSKSPPLKQTQEDHSDGGEPTPGNRGENTSVPAGSRGRGGSVTLFRGTQFSASDVHKTKEL